MLEKGRTPTALAGEAVVLVIDDDPLVRSIMARSLERAGHRVIVAEDAEAALRHARRQSPPVDVLVADLVMPDMSGAALATAVRDVSPATRVVYVSGCVDADVCRPRPGVPEGPCLQKPFFADALNDIVRAVLDR